MTSQAGGFASRGSEGRCRGRFGGTVCAARSSAEASTECSESGSPSGPRAPTSVGSLPGPSSANTAAHRPGPRSTSKWRCQPRLGPGSPAGAGSRGSSRA